MLIDLLDDDGRVIVLDFFIDCVRLYGQNRYEYMFFWLRNDF